MRFILTLIVIIYLGGVAYVLAPIFEARWNSGTPAELFAAVWQDIPKAVAWPAIAYHSVMGPSPDQPATAPTPAPSTPAATETPKP